MPENKSEFLTLDAAAELLCVSEKTIRNYIAAGTLKASRIGGRIIRIRRSDIDAALKPVN